MVASFAAVVLEAGLFCKRLTESLQEACTALYNDELHDKLMIAKETKGINNTTAK